MKIKVKKLKIMHLRTDLAFIHSDECQGGPNKPEEKKEILRKIKEIENEPNDEE
jgi:hypothetical protein